MVRCRSGSSPERLGEPRRELAPQHRLLGIGAERGGEDAGRRLPEDRLGDVGHVAAPPRPLLAEDVDGDPGGDAVEPGGEGGLLAELGEVLVHAHEGLLGDVPGQIPVLHDSERHGVDPSLVTDDELPERLRVAAPGSFHQFEIG